MNDEQRGGDGPSDAWEEAEGHVGAAPPPSWNRPEGWTAPTPGAGPGSTWASDTPPPRGSHDVVDDPPSPPLPNYNRRKESKGKPYGVGTFGDEDSYYNRRRRYLGQRRPVRTYASGRGPGSTRRLAWLVLIGTVLFWTGVAPGIAALIAWGGTLGARGRAQTRSFRAPGVRGWFAGSIWLTLATVGGILLLVLVGSSPTGSGTNYPDSLDLTGHFGTAYTVQAQASYGPAKHDPFVPVRISATNYQDNVDLPQSPDVTATVDLTLCATTSALDSDEVRFDVHLTGPSGDEIDTVDDMPGAGEQTTEIYRHTCLSLPVGFHVPKGSDVDNLEYDPIPQTVTWALPAPTPSP